MLTVTMTVNGQQVAKEVDPRTLLVQFLREQLNLTGTHVGCDTSQCGACVVHVDGKSGEGLHHAGRPGQRGRGNHHRGAGRQRRACTPCRPPFKEHHGLQCGFCTPGMIMSAVDLLQSNPDPSEQEIREWLEGNICRCTGYHNIVKAIRHAAQEMRS